MHCLDCTLNTGVDLVRDEKLHDGPAKEERGGLLHWCSTLVHALHRAHHHGQAAPRHGDVELQRGRERGEAPVPEEAVREAHDACVHLTRQPQK